MLKRTSVFLDEAELEELRHISFIQNTSMAEVLRRFVSDGCRNFSVEQKDIMEALSKIQDDAKKRGITPKIALDKSVELQQKVRRERKAKNRC